jgi:hypothetical protein
MRDILRNYMGFTNTQIRVLTDRRATKAGILQRLAWLVKDAKAGDTLVFHYSGHGSQIRDRDGDELEDGMDELICPADFDWEGTFITDDDLHAIFKPLPAGVTLEVFLDACHSGTGMRDIEFGRPADLGPAGGRPQSVPRFLPPPIDIVCRHEGEEDQLKQVQLFNGMRDVAPESASNQVLWAGCRSDQTSADAYIDGKYNGAFTYYFCYHMRRSNGDLSRKDLLSRIRSSLSHGGYSQIPQLEATTKLVDAHALSPVPTPAPAKKPRK